MIKCEVIKEFTLKRFNELKNIQRLSLEENGRLFAGDTFECEKDLADYLLGNNAINEVVVKVIEVIPEKIEKPVEEIKVSFNNLNVEDTGNGYTPIGMLTKKTTKKKKTSKK